MAELPPAPPRAYLDGLRMLARRELSATQLRQRLLARQHDPSDVDEAIQRLTTERALDDTRTAAAIARTAQVIKRLGPRGALRLARDAGIPASIAEEAVAAAYAPVDASSAIEDLIDRRLAGHRGPIDETAAARVYRYLVSRGHDADLVSRALRRRRRGVADGD